MGLVNKINQMRKKGKSEKEIINIMQQQGNSPAQIKNAIDQSSVKNAISPPEGNENSGFENSLDAPAPPQQENNQMQQQNIPSQAPSPSQNQNAQQEAYSPQPQEQAYQPQPQQAYSPQPQQSFESYDQGYGGNYDQEGYDQGYGGSYDQGYGGGSTDFMMDIAEQVFSENIKEIQSKVEKLEQNTSLNQNKMQNMEDRLKRIEKMFDLLQTKILEKVGSYGQDLRATRKEMQMMQDSFSKVAQPLLDKSKQSKKNSKKKTSKK